MPISAVTPEVAADFAADVRAGLNKPGQKDLPSKYFYDDLGSKLFEAITELPEYGLTRADERLLRAHAADIAQNVPGDVIVCELGSGSGRKTRWILEAFARRGPLSYYPVEISAGALEVCRREFSDLESVRTVDLESEYLDGLNEVAARRTDGQRILVLFLGSTIGNFTPPADTAFLREIRAILRPGDALLLGTDLEKPVQQLLTAYDDPLGVTAAFNLNLLARINRELGGKFILSQFAHEARFNPDTHSIEMHIRSLTRQCVPIRAAGIVAALDEGETIWTETSHKYSLGELTHMAGSAGFSVDSQWIDSEWPFAETLLK